ncbi:flagellar biosynthetic protein FliP [Rhodopirellula sp. MGV]|nr:flagellar biosynthetic protein FliP [Rhodopirellula sp. MGV]PNY34759.1 flagellar biosynthetic protein FliP [Rhodopirellula baltica]
MLIGVLLRPAGALCAAETRDLSLSQPVVRSLKAVPVQLDVHHDVVSQQQALPEPSGVGQGSAEDHQPTSLPAKALETFAGGPNSWASPENARGSLQTMLLLSVVSLAPAVLLMTTCYVRIIVVLSLLRQAIGVQSLPPTQVLTSISLFMTMLVMTPVWTRVYDEAIEPYSDPESGMAISEAYELGTLPVREFMANQITTAKNVEDIFLFYRHAFPEGARPSTFADIPMRVMLPAFVISELKVAFLMGFSIFLPFLVIDLVVASVTMSMGMFMLPPAMISMPLKLLLFVLVDGWHQVAGMLLNSFV